MKSLVIDTSDVRDVDYTVIHHSNMLRDSQRLLCYKLALEKSVTITSTVVDIGTGMGILAAYAASMTQNTVYAIEYFDVPFNFAKKLIASSPFSNVTLLKGSSFDIALLKS